MQVFFKVETKVSEEIKSVYGVILNMIKCFKNSLMKYDKIS